jgi:hypothetical protein
MSKEYETESIDKLFLELSQITKARTAREGKLILLVQSLSNKISKKEPHDQYSILDVAKAENDFYGTE